MSISQTCLEVSFLVQPLKDIISIDFEPVHINNDNQGAIALVKNSVKHHKLKYINIRYHFIREYYQSNKITLSYVRSNENHADIFTKPIKKVSKLLCDLLRRYLCYVAELLCCFLPPL